MKTLFPAFLVAFALSAQAQITSTFDANADGWAFLNGGTPVTVNHSGTNGNPGGYISVNYSSNSTATSQGWFAPAKFLGSQVAKSYGMNLHFDLQQAFAGTASSGQGDVRIQTSAGSTIVFSLPAKPAVAPAWSSYTIKLDETGGWRVSSTGGVLATKTDVIRALSNITTLEIRGTYITNASNVVGIDNVILEQKTLADAPGVTSFSPLSEIPGASVTINGNNFGAAAAQNAVYFGTTKATITSGNATQLVVTVPAGSQFGPITVINLTTGLSVQSSQSFSPLFDNNKDFGGRIIPSSFDLKDDLNLPAGSGGITGLDLGDLDGDGRVDIIATEIKSSPTAYQELLVFRNLGVTGDINASSFASKIVLGQGADDCIVVDLDGDGKLDIVGSYSASFINYYITYRNISTPGTIAFEAPESFQNSTSVGDLHAADIDGDGRPDLMGTHPSVGLYYYFVVTQNLSTPGDILLGAMVAPDPVITGSREISTGDLTGDGKLEIIVSNGGAFRIFHNQSTPGTIALAPPVLIDPTFNVTNVEVADLDNDGKLDLSWASGVAASAIRIRKNIYAGGVLDESSFGPEVVITSPAFAPDRLSLTDINGDEKLDLVTTNVTNLGIFENTFSGTLNANSFQAPVLFQGTTFNTNPVRPVIADLDGDNKPDVVTATAGSTSNLQIFIFRNTCFPAPVINSVTPITGEAGTSLTLSGNFMNTGFENPKVKLGLTSTPTGTVSNTSVSSSIPAGASSDRVSVTLHGLTAFSKPVAVTFPTLRTINAASFTAPIEFALTNAFSDFTVAADNLTVADFDDDGKTDVVVNDNNLFRIFRNTMPSNGIPISSTSLTSIATTYTGTARLAATDIDGDGKTDLFASTFIHRNNSGATADAISFEPAVQHIVAGTTGVVVGHDYNHDGKSDFVHTGGNLYQVEENASRQGAFTNFGGGPFSTIVNSSISAAAGGQPEKIIADDFDGDGYDDLAYGVNAGSDFLAVVRNTGLNQPLVPAQFAPAVTFPALDLPYSIASADFDGDGKPDIVLGNNNAAFISIYKNTSTAGSISFLAKQDIAALTRAIAIAAVDLDGDGKSEIIVAHKPTTTTGSFTVFQNTSTAGTISFSPGINYPLTRGPLSLAIADINLDAKPDLIFTANGATDALMIFENKIAGIPPPTITSFTPTSGPVGTTVTITGTNFDITPSNNIIRFNGTTAVVTASTATSITTTVPAGATTGTITVMVAGNSAISATDFTVTVPALPTITSFTPASGPVGTTVTITGTNFSTTPVNNTVQFNGTTAVVTASTATSITTTVPPGATTGKISVTVDGNTAISATDFTVTVAPALPTITSFTPPSGPTGTTVTITGTNFSTTPVNNTVQFNGAGAVVTASTATSITTTVPAGATTGKISVTVGGNTATSATDFTVTVGNQPPVIETSTVTIQPGGTATFNLLSLISDVDNNLDPASLSISEQPISGATASIDAAGVLTIDYAGILFSGQDRLTIQACDFSLSCAQQEITIEVAGDIIVYNAVSPNGDTKNDFLFLQYIEVLQQTRENKVTIFNRWGDVVFEIENYNNNDRVFEGFGSNKKNELVAGIYFYKIEFASGHPAKTGFLQLKR
jgi:gliding motility-associated-like protein